MDTKNWVANGAKGAGELENVCQAERTQLFSTLSQTKAECAERTRRSFENIFPGTRYMEDY